MTLLPARVSSKNCVRRFGGSAVRRFAASAAVLFIVFALLNSVHYAH